MRTKDPGVDHPQLAEITAGESWAERSLGTAKCVLRGAGGKEGSGWEMSASRVYYGERSLREA